MHIYFEAAPAQFGELKRNESSIHSPANDDRSPHTVSGFKWSTEHSMFHKYHTFIVLSYVLCRLNLTEIVPRPCSFIMFNALNYVQLICDWPAYVFVFLVTDQAACFSFRIPFDPCGQVPFLPRMFNMWIKSIWANPGLSVLHAFMCIEMRWCSANCEFTEIIQIFSCNCHYLRP